MKFTVRRASGNDSENPPIPEAVQNDDGYYRWAVHIETLDDLMSLVKREGDIIVGDGSLIIYDDYVE